jgi:hypothetical protein
MRNATSFCLDIGRLLCIQYTSYISQSALLIEEGIHRSIMLSVLSEGNRWATLLGMFPDAPSCKFELGFIGPDVIESGRIVLNVS